jgi:hypothetical protein
VVGSVALEHSSDVAQEVNAFGMPGISAA